MSSTVAEMGGHLATVDTGRKVGDAVCARSLRELGPHLMACVEAHLRVKFHLDPSSLLATIHQHQRQNRTDRTTVR